MRASTTIHDAAATLLEYPDGAKAHLREEAAATLRDAFPAIAAPLDGFAATSVTMAAGSLEESYAAAFDNTADRALEVGWHAFGENYARGAFLVRMRERIRESGLVESAELPDHLSHVLRVLGRIDARQARLLAEALVLPAVEKMLQATPPSDHWRPALDAARHVLLSHVSAEEPAHV